MEFHRIAPIWIATLLLTLLVAPGSQAEDTHQYAGVKDCARCHKRELIGDQYHEWLKGPHAQAYEKLKGPDAVRVGKEKGLTKPPHEADECVKCHATAFGVTAAMTAKRPLLLSDGVQCESCHGPGSGYRKKTIMSDHAKAVAAGMWEPGKNAEICTACHNSESPSWDPAKGFDHAASVKKIAHPIPEEVKGRYIEAERAARKAGGAGPEDDEED